MAKPYGIVIHGGAGTILPIFMTPEIEAEYHAMLAVSLQAGYDILDRGGSALDAVEAAVVVMEDSDLFKAGKGAVFTNEGTNEQDASIMDGVTLNGGAVCAVKHIKNPIKLTRKILDHSDHILFSGEGAERFAKEHGIEIVAADYFFTDKRWQQLEKAKAKEAREQKAFSALDHSTDNQLGDEGKHGTVGAVALDKHGNLAAATSSDKAAEYVIYRTLTELGGTGGLIALDNEGHFALPFNTSGMYRGYLMSDQSKPLKPFTAIFEDK